LSKILKKISAQTGFKSNNINKAIKDYHGITPEKFRKENKVPLRFNVD